VVVVELPEMVEVEATVAPLESWMLTLWGVEDWFSKAIVAVPGLAVRLLWV
jgi:hypothetical protein